MSDDNTIPLCVDLDGTLLKTDSLYESLWQAIRLSPGILLEIPVLLIRGRAVLKARLARTSGLDATRLPLRPEVVALLRTERERGRRLVLATASNEQIAQSVARKLGIFSEVIASDSNRNLKGPAKAQALVSRFGENGFDYIGDSTADAAVWLHARKGWIAGSNRRARRRVPHAESIHAPDPPNPVATIFRALRVHQWSKNLLVFIPVLVAHSYSEAQLWPPLLLAFIGLCLTASGIYLLNDLIDLAADRANSFKRCRPLASGDFPIVRAMVLSPLLVVLGVVLSALTSHETLLLVLLYVVLTSAYTFALKRIRLLDVFTLAGLYILRIWIGGLATGITVSEWLIAFSLFLFLSLAMAKRCAELLHAQQSGSESVEGRSYSVDDLDVLSIFGIAAAYVSVLVLALYLNSPKSSELYRAPELLWLICPLLLYWLSRIWLIAHRGSLSEDPVLFALHDRASFIIGVLVLMVVAIAGPN